MKEISMTKPNAKPDPETLDDQDVDTAVGGAKMKSPDTKAGGNDVLQQEWTLTYEAIQRVK
jgi:hypothetical protein